MINDPHVFTFDGMLYRFQAVGEYAAIRSDGGDIEVQVRLVPAGTSGRASRLAGVAVLIDGRTLVIDNAGESLVTLDGQPFDAAGFAATENGSLILRDESVLALLWPDASTSVSVTGIGGRWVNLYATLDSRRTGRVTGLLGNADGRQDNDLALPDGTSVDDSFDSLYGAFRDGWRVTGQESLFPGPSTFDALYPVAPVELTRQEEAAARDRCLAEGVLIRTLLESCIIDIALTDDDDYARRYGAEQRPRLLIDGRCAAGVGDPVSMAGLGPGRTYEASGQLIEGELAWEFSVDDRPTPIVFGVSETNDGFVVVDGHTGLHFVDRSGGVRNTVEAKLRPHVPTVTTERVFAIAEDGLLAVALDGVDCWKLVGYEGERFQSLGLHDGRLFATTFLAGVGTIVAVDPETGSLHWSRSFAGSIGAPAMDADSAILALYDEVVALDLESGSTRWRLTGGPPDAALAARGGVFHVAIGGGASRGLVAIDLETGEQVWRWSGPILADLAVSQSHVVGVAGRMAFAIDADDGSLTWTLGEDERIGFSQPAIAGDIVYLLRRDQTLVALAVVDGTVLLQTTMAASVGRHAPLPSGDLVLVIDELGGLHAYR